MDTGDISEARTPDGHDVDLSPDGQRPEVEAIDLDVIEQDLADVERALARLDDGTYWTCEVTGAPLGDDLMISSPTARRLPTT